MSRTVTCSRTVLVFAFFVGCTQGEHGTSSNDAGATEGDAGVVATESDDAGARPPNDAGVTTEDATGGDALPSAGPDAATDSGGPISSIAAKKAALLAYIAQIVAKDQLLLGEHWDSNDTPPTAPVTQIDTATGQYPAILGLGFDWSGESDAVALAEPWAVDGGIVFGGSWFTNPATGGSQSDLNITFSDLLDSSTPTYKAWYAELDATAAKMLALQSAGIVVLYRPFIELNGNWFWWGNQTASQFIAVWKAMYDYFVTTKGIRNVLWVYNVNAKVGNYAEYYPGDAYADIVSFDYYGSSPASDIASTYSALLGIDKPMMEAEFGCLTSNWQDIEPFTCDNNELISQTHESFPKLFSVAVWGDGNWAIPDQNGEAAIMAEPWVVNRAALPSGI